MTELRRLTLIFAAAHEAEVTSVLIEHSPPLPGFTLFKAEGHSSDFTHASPREQVRGRIERRVVWMVLPKEAVAQVIELLRPHVRQKALLWWTEPVEDFGRLM
ncbi:MAG: DUF3240 family protein [Zoogloeaceae bacterium]|jgi:hypothetical protein|nr:DUF3240 family protein [Zoogloeaceae bacterium]